MYEHLFRIIFIWWLYTVYPPMIEMSLNHISMGVFYLYGVARLGCEIVKYMKVDAPQHQWMMWVMLPEIPTWTRCHQKLYVKAERKCQTKGHRCHLNLIWVFLISSYQHISTYINYHQCHLKFISHINFEDLWSVTWISSYQIWRSLKCHLNSLKYNHINILSTITNVTHTLW